MTRKVNLEWLQSVQAVRDLWRGAAENVEAAGRHRLGQVAATWAAGIVVAAVVIGAGDAILEGVGWQARLLIEPARGTLETVVQVVPAIVVAIFVFAVGTQFVVAQVVPTARGTRAVEVLRARHLEWTLSPALALTPLSALVLVLDQRLAWPLASALLLGAVAYLLISTGFLLSILGEATDPVEFAGLLAARHEEALRRLNIVAEVEMSTPGARLDKGRYGQEGQRIWKQVKKRAEKLQEQAQHEENPQHEAQQAETQRAETRQDETQQAETQPKINEEAHRAAVADVRQIFVDDLYGVVRTLRGWARSSATAGDSRELQVALEGTLSLVHSYAAFPVDKRCGVPSDYNRSALNWKKNPLREEASSGRDYVADHEPWVLWVPPPCPHDPDSNDIKQLIESGSFDPPPDEPGNEKAAQAVRQALARIWVANEVGRSLVRAVEFATTTKTLLDRDRARLLLSLDKAARRFTEHQDYTSAGVMVAYLVELGLGARRCPPDEVDWHFEPLARLAAVTKDHSHRAAPDFAIGTAAAVIKVAEAIAEARVGEHYDRQSGRAWQGIVDVCDDSVITIVERTVEDLRSISDVGKEFTLKAMRAARPDDSEAPRNALELAEKPLLEPRGQAAIRPTDSKLMGLVHAVLLCTADQWSGGKRNEWITGRKQQEWENQEQVTNGWA